MWKECRRLLELAAKIIRKPTAQFQRQHPTVDPKNAGSAAERLSNSRRRAYSTCTRARVLRLYSKFIILILWQLLHNGIGSGQSFTPGGQTHFPLPPHTCQGGHPSQHSVTLMHCSLHSFVPAGQTHFPLMHALPLMQPPQGTTGMH